MLVRAAVAALLIISLSACTVNIGVPQAAQESQPKSDAEQIEALANDFVAALHAADDERFLSLFCPGVRSDLEPVAWFKSADRVGTFDRIESFSPPDGGTAAPDATEWRRVFFDSDGRLRVAKIDGKWYACET